MPVPLIRPVLRCLLVLGAFVALLPLTAASASASTSARAIASAKAGINGMRGHTGARPLATSASLDRSATAFARRMLRTHRFAHASRILASSHFRALGETLALQPGRRPSASTAVRLWSHSAPHRSVLTNGEFRKIGVGTATGRFRGRTVTMWVAQVGR